MSALNIMKITTKDAIAIKRTVDIDPNQFLIPPPEALLAKSAFVPEEAMSGGDVAFVKL